MLLEGLLVIARRIVAIWCLVVSLLVMLRVDHWVLGMRLGILVTVTMALVVLLLMAVILPIVPASFSMILSAVLQFAISLTALLSFWPAMIVIAAGVDGIGHSVGLRSPGTLVAIVPWRVDTEPCLVKHTRFLFWYREHFI